MTQTVRTVVVEDDVVTSTQPPLIAFLRLSALACRAAPRGSLRACALLDPDAGAEDYAMALARTLPEMTMRRPVIWRPGATGRSFDEDWLLSLLDALRRRDGASLRFLTRSRVRPEAAPYLLLVLRGLCERLDSAA